MHKLTATQQTRLIAVLAAELAGMVAMPLPTPPPTSRLMTPEQARATLAEIQAALSALPQPRISLAEQLERDRRSREATLMGYDTAEGMDVYA